MNEKVYWIWLAYLHRNVFTFSINYLIKWFFFKFVHGQSISEPNTTHENEKLKNMRTTSSSRYSRIRSIKCMRIFINFSHRRKTENGVFNNKVIRTHANICFFYDVLCAQVSNFRQRKSIIFIKYAVIMSLTLVHIRLTWWLLSELYNCRFHCLLVTHIAWMNGEDRSNVEFGKT